MSGREGGKKKPLKAPKKEGKFNRNNDGKHILLFFVFFFSQARIWMMRT